MMVFRVIIFVTILSVISWIILKMLNRPVHLAILFVSWAAIFLMAVVGFYGLSIFVTNSNNMT